jgi:capsular polysaccharide export protein
MIVYPAEYNDRKEAVFTALASVGGGGRRLGMIPLSLHDYPETKARVADALARAKRPGKSALGRWIKRLLLRGQYNWSRRYFTAYPKHIAVAWNGLGGSRQLFLQAARDAGAATLHAELSPFPGRITLDPVGVNAEGSVPQDPTFFRDWAKTHPTANWRALGASLTARPSRRTDVGQGQGAIPDAPFLFCPLQVPNDSQVTLFAGWFGGMEGFLSALHRAAANLPPGWHLRLKEHPSAKLPLGPMIAPLVASGRVILDNTSDSFAQMTASRGVVTLNSSMGLQAFFHDKPVISLGRAFWAISGLAVSVADQAALDLTFSAPEALTYDADLRAAFVTWLGEVYYPAFAEKPLSFDGAAFARKLEQAQALSPAFTLR